MVEVFISYSRSDNDFVRQLHGELAKRGVEAWVDWEDIPPSAEWWQDICSAIEKTDAVVFVMSPDSIASRVCSDELAHAIRHNKHVIPVVWRPVDPRAHPGLEIPAALAKINWIFFRPEEGEFFRACDQLVTAASTDLDWVHAHSRALTRAIEWERQGRDDSFLLRKNDLTQAEAWLAKGPEKDPKPTVLQAEYILTSRRAAIRARRRLHTAIWSTAAILLVIGAVALWQYRLSEERGRNDFSRQLSNLSRSTLDTQPDLALLLAAEAHAVANTFDARNALLTGLHRTRGVSAFLHERAPRIFDMSPDGSHAAIVTCQVPTVQGDCKTHRLQLLRLRDLATVAHRDFTQWVTDVTFREDGMLGVLYCCSKDESGLLEWLQVPSLQPKARLLLPAASNPDSVELLDRTRFLTESSVVRDAFSNRVVARLPVQGVSSPVIAAHPTAPVFLVLSGAGDPKVARLWDARTNETQTLEGDGAPGEYRVAAFNHDGSQFAAGGCAVPTGEGYCEEGQVDLWSLGDQGIQHELVRNLPEAVGALVFLPQAGLLVSGGCASMEAGKCGRGEIRLWNSSDLQPADVLRLHTHTVSRLRVSSDGAVMLSGGWEAGLILWRTGSPDGVFRPDPFSGIPSGALVESADIAPARPQGMTLSATCSLGDRDCAGQVKAQMQIGQAVPLDALLTSFKGDPEKQEIRLVRSAEAPKLAIAGCGRATSGSERDIYLGREGTVCATPRLVVVDLGDGRQRPMPTAGLQGEITAVGFDRAGRYLATASCRGRWKFECDHTAVRVWDLSDPGEPKAVMEGQGYVSALAFAPDAKTVALGICTLPGSLETPEFGVCRGSEVRLLSLATGKAHGLPLPGYPEEIQSVAVAPDGLTVAASGEEGGIAVWDVERGELLGPPFIAPPGSGLPVAFSGNTRIESGPPNARIVWTLDPTRWRERACRTANRRLSADERRRYLLDDSGRPDVCATLKMQ